MKKSFLLTISLLFLSIVVFSQEVSVTKTKLALIFSPQFQAFKPDKSYLDGSTNSGLHWGVCSDFYFAENYAIRTGVFYHLFQQDFKFATRDGIAAIPVMRDNEIVEIENGTTVNYKLRYFDIPIGIKLQTDEVSSMVFFVDLGFNNMINVNATGTSNDAAKTLDSDNTKKDFSFYHLGFHAGIGAEYPLFGETQLTASLNYMSGIGDVTNESSAKREADKVRLNAFEIKIGIIF